MKDNKQIKKEGIFDAADRFVTKFFDGLSTGAANTIIKKAQSAKLPPEHIAFMKKMEKDADDFRKLMKDL